MLKYSQRKFCIVKNKTKFDKWDHRFMELAGTVASWSNCIREGRQIGAVIARDKRILTLGYNGAPAGVKTCADRGVCLRNAKQIESGTQLQLCYSVCAEQNAIVQAAYLGNSIKGATMYTTHEPCTICTRLIISSGITRVVYDREYPDPFAKGLVKECGIPFEKYTKE